MPKDKLVLGVPFYGRGFKLETEKINFGGIWHSDTAYLDAVVKETLRRRTVVLDDGATVWENIRHAAPELAPM